MPAHIFREYDIRGVADRDLTDDLVEAIGRGLAHMLAPPGAAPRLVLGQDCRESGPRIAAAMTRGLRAGGAHVLDIGVGPTPRTYFAVHHLDADGAVMITGSHNPADENGFKIMRGKAPFFGGDIQRLWSLVESGELPDAGGAGAGSVESVPMDAAYLDRLTRDIELPRGLRVAVDAGNGVAGPLAIEALRSLGVEPLALYCDMDGRFPNHHPDPTVPDNLEALLDAVRRGDIRVGIAFDGDGDRLGVVDPSGEIVWGDRLLALFARDVLRDHPGAQVLGEVKCSKALFDDVARHGGQPVVWKTGHSLIKTKMKEDGALLAGEMSGHFFFADRYYGYDDALYAMLRLLEIVGREGKTVVELLADLPKGHSTPEIRVECPDAIKRDVVAGVRQRFEGRYAMSTIDGIRIEHDDGAWALVRASNTGPVIVLRFEAPSRERLGAIRSEVESALDQARRSVQRLEGDG